MFAQSSGEAEFFANLVRLSAALRWLAVMVIFVGWWHVGWWRAKSYRHTGAQTDVVEVEAEVAVPVTLMPERRREVPLFAPFREKITVASSAGNKYHF